MTEKTEYRGLWWRPEKPDDKVPGVLYFTSFETATLELIPTFWTKSRGMYLVLPP